MTSSTDDAALLGLAISLAVSIGVIIMLIGVLVKRRPGPGFLTYYFWTIVVYYVTSLMQALAACVSVCPSALAT